MIRKYVYISIIISMLIGIMEYRYVSLESEMLKRDVENSRLVQSMSVDISRVQKDLDHSISKYKSCISSINKMSTERTVEKILEDNTDYERIFTEDNSSFTTGSYTY